jgi:hypothetical protein
VEIDVQDPVDGEGSMRFSVTQLAAGRQCGAWRPSAADNDSCLGFVPGEMR